MPNSKELFLIVNEEEKSVVRDLGPEKDRYLYTAEEVAKILPQLKSYKVFRAVEVTITLKPIVTEKVQE